MGSEDQGGGDAWEEIHLDELWAAADSEAPEPHLAESLLSLPGKNFFFSAPCWVLLPVSFTRILVAVLLLS